MSRPDEPLSVKRMTDEELLFTIGSVRPDTPFAEQLKFEMQIRIADRQAKAAAESSKLGGRIWWLNVWLLVFTVAICVLTAVLVAKELGWLRAWVQHP